MEPGAEQTIELTLIYEWIADVRCELEREIDQAICKRDIYLAVAALSGREACDRIKRQLEARFRVRENYRQMELGLLPKLKPRPRLKKPEDR